MKLLIPVAVLNFAVLTHPWPNNDEVRLPVKVSIYYETLCSDSASFITRQLYPAYKKLRSLMSLEFVPYGKASYKKMYGLWVFKCQHGPLEYWGNKVQACALALRTGQDAEMEFIHCFMSRSPSKQTINTCSAAAGIPYLKLMKCVESEIGDAYLVKYGKRTNEALPIVKFVPTIIINDKYDDNTDKMARTNFTATIMGALNKRSSAREKMSDSFNANDIYDALTKALYGYPNVEDFDLSTIYF